MEPRRFEFYDKGLRGGYDCVFNYDGLDCHHPWFEGKVDGERCPDDHDESTVPSWCPLRQRPALVALRTEP